MSVPSVPLHVAGDRELNVNVSLPIKEFAVKTKTNIFHNQSSFAPHALSQTISRIPPQTGVLQGVGPICSLITCTSVPPVQAGGSSCAEHVNFALLKESSSLFPSNVPWTYFEALQPLAGTVSGVRKVGEHNPKRLHTSVYMQKRQHVLQPICLYRSLKYDP